MSFLNTLGTLPIVGAWFYAEKIRSLYLYRSFDAASKVIAKTEDIATGLPGQIKVSEAYFYSCLMLAATERLTADSDTRIQDWSLFDRNEKQMKLWADHCPENYLHKYYLIKGERARLEHGSLDEVLAWYDKAIQSAKESNFPNNRGPCL